MVNFGPPPAEIGWRVWGTPANVNRFRVLASLYCTDVVQPNFARCLSVSCAGTLCIHFRGYCPLTEFCQVQNSLSVQMLRSPILTALPHDTRAVDVRQTLRHSAVYFAGRPSRWASAHILVLSNLYAVRDCHAKLATRRQSGHNST